MRNRLYLSTPELRSALPAVRDIILWNRIGRISVLLAKRLNIEPERAFDIFYESDTCEHLHDETSGLYLMGDLYVVDEVMIELQRKQG